MNRKQRDANRQNARALRPLANLVICERCGDVTAFGHYVQPGGMFGHMWSGFYTCPDLYGADGRRKEADDAFAL